MKFLNSHILIEVIFLLPKLTAYNERRMYILKIIQDSKNL